MNQLNRAVADTDSGVDACASGSAVGRAAPRSTPPAAAPPRQHLQRPLLSTGRRFVVAAPAGRPAGFRRPLRRSRTAATAVRPPLLRALQRGAQCDRPHLRCLADRPRAARTATHSSSERLDQQRVNGSALRTLLVQPQTRPAPTTAGVRSRGHERILDRGPARDDPRLRSGRLPSTRCRCPHPHCRRLDRSR